MKLIRVGVDLAKNVFQVHGVDRNEKPVWRRRLTRDNWLRALLETVERGCQIGMEACGGTHYWARKLADPGPGTDVRSVGSDSYTSFDRTRMSARPNRPQMSQLSHNPAAAFMQLHFGIQRGANKHRRNT